MFSRCSCGNLLIHAFSLKTGKCLSCQNRMTPQIDLPEPRPSVQVATYFKDRHDNWHERINLSTLDR